MERIAPSERPASYNLPNFRKYFTHSLPFILIFKVYGTDHLSIAAMVDWHSQRLVACI
ncbi:MAG: hypothetical protein KA293_08020 [Bacteroidia bacterium]|nr:hypothetical protein [Bacteroidia bacterium]